MSSVRSTDGLTPLRIANQRRYRGSQSLVVADVHEELLVCVTDHLGHACIVCPSDGQSMLRGFQSDHGESLVVRRHQHDIRVGVRAVETLGRHVPQKVGPDGEVAVQAFESILVASAPDDSEVVRLLDPSERTERVHEPFLWFESSDDQQSSGRLR